MRWKPPVRQESRTAPYDLLVRKGESEVPEEVPEKRGSSVFLARNGRQSRGSWWQWLLLPLCIVCQIIGVHVPLIYTETWNWARLRHELRSASSLT